jgi:prephenate dehydrogenase
MAGLERFGFVNATDSLFNGASMILTPPENMSSKHMEILQALFSKLGFGGICLTTPEIHDKTIAYTSQLAHVLSSAYVKIEEATTHRGFSAGSFQDMTRVARLNETMWTELFMQNRDYLADKIDELVGYLTEYSRAIRQGEQKTLKDLLREGRLRKENIEAGGAECKK